MSVPHDLHGAVRRSVWSFSVENQPSGSLELYLTAAGFVWHWQHKPAHLVAIAGVPDDTGESGGKTPVLGKAAYRFFDEDGAIGHIMESTAFAFDGLCALEAVH
jgi:hypothetical protein